MKRKNILMMVIVFMLSFSVLVSALPIASTHIIATKDIRVSMVNQEPDPVEPGQYVTVKFKVENYGSVATAPLVVGIKPMFPFTLLDGYDYEQQVSGLERRQYGDDSEIIEWRLLVDKNAAEGDNEIVVYYKELTGKQAEIISKETLYIDVRTSDTILEVIDISTEPEFVVPGQESQLNIKLKNLGDSFIKDVTVNLDLDGLNIATIGSTSEKILQKMDGKQEIVVSFTIMPSSTTGLEALKIPLELKFKDNINTEYIQNATFGLLIDSPVEYVLNVDDNGLKTVDQSGEITVRISNLGLNNIKFLKAELKPSPDYKILSSPTVYVGEVESDDFESITYKLYAEDVDEENILSLRLLLTYKDDYNKDYSSEEEIKVQLFTSKEVKKYGLVQQSSNAGLIFFIVIVLAGGGYYWYRRKKKKQKLAGKK